METVLLYFNTIIHLRPIQIYYRIFYKFRAIIRKLIGFQYVQFISSQSHQITLKPSIPSNRSYFSEENRFQFLNQSQVFEPNKINWNDEQTFGKLWAYNLNYFEFLNQSNLTQTQGLALIRAYIQAHPTLQTGVEPYPTSLRNLNWIKFLTKFHVRDLEIDGFLMAQYVRLMDNLEYHLMGNHLLENAFSMLFGAYYYRNEAFFKKASQLLQQQLTEQILTDGGHIERSSMYHQILLFRLLDCLNLVKNNDVFERKYLDKILITYAQKMLNFLQNITFKNGDIPLINDAARNIAPTTKQLISYSNSLNINSLQFRLGATGYRKISKSNYELLMDVSSMTPAYLPGHAHAGALSFLLYVNEKPFLVDTGTSTYQNNKIRALERSTSAHNTVQVGDFNQSEMWASFRVGRRARTIILSESEHEITASHDGYKRQGVIHKRTFIAENQSIVITDEIIGVSKHPHKAQLHFHPNVEITIEGNIIKTNLGNITVKNILRITENKCKISEEFNVGKPSKMITLFFNQYLTTVIDFLPP